VFRRQVVTELGIEPTPELADMVREARSVPDDRPAPPGVPRLDSWPGTNSLLS
jgi:hypothetical protein